MDVLRAQFKTNPACSYETLVPKQLYYFHYVKNQFKSFKIFLVWALGQAFTVQTSARPGDKYYSNGFFLKGNVTNNVIIFIQDYKQIFTSQAISIVATTHRQRIVVVALCNHLQSNFRCSFFWRGAHKYSESGKHGATSDCKAYKIIFCQVT